jgi:DNA-binding NarL/FixJ family response regulator
MIHIGLTDDQPLFTAGLAMMINAQPDMRVEWQAIDGDDAIRQHKRNPVDLLLLDIHMPGTDGLTATRRLIASHAPGKVVILTTFDTDQYVLDAVEAGASGFLLKNTAPDQLLDAVRTVHRGDAVISPAPTRRLLARVRTGLAPDDTTTSAATPGQQPPAPITAREHDVLLLVANGLTNREICDRLWLSMPTVKTHIGNLLAKTQSRDRVQLVLYALRTRIVRLSDALDHQPHRPTLT